MEKAPSILGFAGSSRKGPYNKALLRAAMELVPKGVRLEAFDFKGIPVFQQNLENEFPKKVKELRPKVRVADVILIATPEADYALPRAVTNAIKWAPRLHVDNALDGKPVVMMGATIATSGTARVQYDLSRSFVFLNMYPLNQLEVMVTLAQGKIEKGGKITVQKKREKIEELL